ncbi:MAG: NDP-sugar synthase [Myxococcales bacterium]|nr:NDP-sugar synthase [Myxococcales bacterium]
MQGIFATPLRAMVLCAGMGSRLGGISDELPKPLLPVCNHPLLTYALALCRGYGMREVAVNLHHLGHLITNTVGNGASLGMDIHFSTEATLLGTGGGVRKMADFLTHDFREPCVVINGKLVVDVDLEAVLALHRVTGATATMVLRETPDADEWGAVEVDADGRVHSILGQKSPAPVAKPPLTRCMFTGIQIVEPQLLLRLPSNESSCIVRQGYVPSLRAGEVLSGYIIPGYFHEHSTPERFLQGNLNVLRGHAKLPYPPGPLVGVHPRAQIAPSATIIAPVCIGAATVVAEGAVVGPDVVLGDGASVAPGVELQRTVVLAGSAVHRSVTSAAITPKATYRLVLPDEESSA